MFRSILAAVLATGLTLAAAPAGAQNVAWSVTVGTGGALGAYVGVPGPVFAPPPVAVYPRAPIYAPTVVVSAPRVWGPRAVYAPPVYYVPRFVHRRGAVWVGPPVRGYPVALPAHAGRGGWRGHGHHRH
jgi:hypothetical protein